MFSLDALIDPLKLESDILAALDGLERVINPTNLAFGTRERGHYLNALQRSLPLPTEPAAACQLVGLLHDRLLEHYGVAEEISTETRPAGHGAPYNCFLWKACLKPPSPDILDRLEGAADVLLKHFPPQSDQQPPISAAESLESCVEQIPWWDKDRRELWLGDKFCKQFRHPSKNQVLILDTFEEEHWPDGIDDPIPRPSRARTSPKTGYAISRLNQNLHIKFERDGTGTRVLWSVKPHSAP
jgi:hypothetical protein